MDNETATHTARRNRRMPLAQSLGSTLVAVALACGLAIAVGTASVQIGGVSAFLLAAVLAFAIQWLAFVPAFLGQTEHYFDLTGSGTYILLALFGLWVGGDARSLLLMILITLWAGRLGSFLFSRVRQTGGDGRFDSIKPDFMQFFMTWTLQGLWVFLTMSPALAAMTATESRSLGIVAIAGTLLWLAGFLIEVIADRQKQAFRRVEANRGRFISSGLWAWSQHPNYFGEILLWCGITLVALPVFSGWQWLTLISPVFVYVLLTKISGIRMLDARARRLWGNDDEYQAYRQRTSTLIPLPPGGN